jgi:hypothetical protein
MEANGDALNTNLQQRLSPISEITAGLFADIQYTAATCYVVLLQAAYMQGRNVTSRQKIYIQIN